MSFSSWLWGTSQVDEAIEKATSELLPSGSEDIALNLEISDQIRSKSIAPKDAMRALKKRLNHKNPNVELLSLSLTDTCVKNGGDHFLIEIASREFMDNLVSLLKTPALNHEVKNKLLRLVQNWAIAFEGKPALTYVGQVYRTLKSEGFSFPPQDFSVANSAMVDTQTAPEWIDSDVCLRCRTPFSFTNRKHHCRNCGQVFDQQCSSKALPLPHFGIQQEVRVCDGCYVKLTRPRREPIDRERDRRQHHRRHSTPHHRPVRSFADEELQRAIQLSLQEVGAANTNGRSHRPGYVLAQPDEDPANWQTSEPPLIESRSGKKGVDEEEDDPDLRAAIEASLREANAPRPSAPVTVGSSPHLEAQSYLPSRPESYTATSSVDTLPPLPNYDLQPLESDVILTFSQTVQDIDSRGGRDISRYPAMNELYDKANGLRPKLALSLDDTDRKEKMLSDMHDKLSQAVKLYDQLLTEQLSRPRRTMSQTGSYGQWSAHMRAQSLPVQHAPVVGSSTNPAFISPAQTQYGASRTVQSPSLSSQSNPAAAVAQTQQYIPPPSVQPLTYAHALPASILSASAPMSVPGPSVISAQFGALTAAQSILPQPTTTAALAFQQPVASGPDRGPGFNVGSAAPHSYSTPTSAPASALLSSQPAQVQAPPPPPPAHYQHYQSTVPPPPLPLQQPQLTIQPQSHSHSQSQLQPQLQPQPQPQLQHAPLPPQPQPQLQPQQQSQHHLHQTQVQSQPQLQPQFQQPRQAQQQQQSPSLAAYTPQSAFPQFPSAPTTELQYSLYEAAQPPPAENKEALLIDL